MKILQEILVREWKYNEWTCYSCIDSKKTEIDLTKQEIEHHDINFDYWIDEIGYRVDANGDVEITVNWYEIDKDGDHESKPIKTWETMASE